VKARLDLAFRAPAAVPARTDPEPDCNFNCEVDPDYLEHLRRERQAELPWEQ
jgi:hypothetical protein